MKPALILFASAMLAAMPALAQTEDARTPAPAAKPVAAKPVGAKPSAAKPAAVRTSTDPATATAAPPPVPQLFNPDAAVERAALDKAVPDKAGVKRLVILRGLDKITGRPSNIFAPIGVPVTYATLSITARYCYSTPISEPPETTAFLQLDDHRPDQDERKVFSGWMLASSPSLNGLQHPLYDVWVIACTTNQPGQQLPVVASTAAVKATSPDATAKEAMPDLPEGAGQ
jgi:hypothetical protein